MGESMKDRLITIAAENESAERRWIDALKFTLGKDAAEMEWGIATGRDMAAWGAMVLVDSEHPDLERILDSIDRHGRSVFLIWTDDMEDWDWGAEYADRVDDLILHPFRKIELQSKFRLHQHLRLWSEVGDLHRSFNDLLAGLDEDVKLAERLQKARLPNRFPAVRGLQIRSRYLAGLKGGDHFDLAESKDQSRISVLISDSSSFGLSSAFLSVLMRMTMKLSRDEARSSTETVKLISDELMLGLKEKDRLAILYGVLNRKDFKFRYLHLGSTVFLHARKGEPFRILDSQGEALSLANSDVSQYSEKEITLEPEDRIVFLSDGFVEACGGAEKAKAVVDPYREKEPADIMNELAFRVKKEMDPDGLPDQDCTALVIDIDAKLLRLA
jgi:serine phosphatase RsbU (regulator of sigma subunit)